MCKRCGGVGYLETWVMRDARMQGLVQQCCDIKAYSERIIRGSTEPTVAPKPPQHRPVAQVLEFRPKSTV